MNIYVETNFLLELAFLQEQHESCEKIAAFSEAGRAKLILPTFSIAESYETLVRRANKRKLIENDLAAELKQLGRSKPYQGDVDVYLDVAGLLVRSSQDEGDRLTTIIQRILGIADIVPLNADIYTDAIACRATYKLDPQDAIVYSCVLHHLACSGNKESCFISRDRHFADPDIEKCLAGMGCKMLFSFIDGWDYIDHFVGP